MSIRQKNSAKKRFFLASFSLLLCLSGLLAGCDNGDENNSDGGTAVVLSSEASSDLNSHLTRAINDEYRAKNTYIAVMNKFGEVQPFANIKNSEEQQISMLVNLFNNYGLPVPANTASGLSVPGTLSEACSLGVQAEIENANMYDELLAGTIDYPDVQTVFKKLQSASSDQHLPAFQECAD
ncbi:hypothetical protein H206_02883 [Candidatus Electrothrix aarhusensis]|uniref:DUF2202 domain-containing protein n=1 Tax=Candidatus Electrothrix aarhusensis TaxID=1859131 RepID=A0A444IRH8_9BACT|nr:hypothetical protein H206_02883 [Candidatus Electrothrix aarhusensis]